MNELFQTQVARNAVKASISAVLAGEEQTLSLPAVELQIRNLQERQLELFQLIVSAGADCTDYDEELRQVNMAKTKLMAKKAELEKEQRGATAFEERLAELDVELEQSCGALTDFDELKQPLELGHMHCHHRIPRHFGGDDKYGNLVLVTDEVHRLLHATQPDTIAHYMLKLKPDSKQLRTLNRLRRWLQLPEFQSYTSY